METLGQCQPTNEDNREQPYNAGIDYYGLRKEDEKRRKEKLLKNFKGLTKEDIKFLLSLPYRQLQEMAGENIYEIRKEEKLRNAVGKVRSAKLTQEPDNSRKAMAERNLRSEEAEKFNQSRTDQWKNASIINGENFGKRTPASDPEDNKPTTKAA